MYACGNGKWQGKVEAHLDMEVDGFSATMIRSVAATFTASDEAARLRYDAGELLLDC
jgi:hypothetical protein